MTKTILALFILSATVSLAQENKETLNNVSQGQPRNTHIGLISEASVGSIYSLMLGAYINSERHTISCGAILSQLNAYPAPLIGTGAFLNYDYSLNKKKGKFDLVANASLLNLNFHQTIYDMEPGVSKYEFKTSDLMLYSGLGANYKATDKFSFRASLGFSLLNFNKTSTICTLSHGSTDQQSYLYFRGPRLVNLRIPYIKIGFSYKLFSK